MAFPSNLSLAMLQHHQQQQQHQTQPGSDFDAANLRNVLLGGGINKHTDESSFGKFTLPNKNRSRGRKRTKAGAGDSNDGNNNSVASSGNAGSETKISKKLVSPKLENSLTSSPEHCEGMFTCDQCDKTFSKQSSLARHKYEHSGRNFFYDCFFMVLIQIFFFDFRTTPTQV